MPLLWDARHKCVIYTITNFKTNENIIFMLSIDISCDIVKKSLKNIDFDSNLTCNTLCTRKSLRDLDESNTFM